MGAPRFRARAVRAALAACLALCAGTARAVPRALQRCDGDPAACAWAAVCMGMPSRQCARPAPTCARWFNGCASCDVVGGLPTQGCEMCVFPSAPTQCELDIRRSPIAGGPPGVQLRVERATPRKASAPCSLRVALDLPSPYALVAIYGDDAHPLELPPAVRQAGALRSEVAPARAQREAPMTAIGVGALDQWGPARGATVTDGAWFAPPPERGAPYDPSFADAPVATFVVPRASRAAPGDFVFNAQVYATDTHRSARLYDLTVRVDAACAAAHPAA